MTLPRSDCATLKSVKFVPLRDIIATSAVAGDYANYKLCTPTEWKTQMDDFISTTAGGESRTHQLSHGSPSTARSSRSKVKSKAKEISKVCLHEGCCYRSKKLTTASILKDLQQHDQQKHRAEPAFEEALEISAFQKQIAEYKKKNTELEKEKAAVEKQLIKASSTQKTADEKRKKIESDLKKEKKLRVTDKRTLTQKLDAAKALANEASSVMAAAEALANKAAGPPIVITPKRKNNTKLPKTALSEIVTLRCYTSDWGEGLGIPRQEAKGINKL